jgi:hypothetical protein
VDFVEYCRFSVDYFGFLPSSVESILTSRRGIFYNLAQGQISFLQHASSSITKVISEEL